MKQLLEAGHRVVVVDNLYRGHAQADPEAPAALGLGQEDRLGAAAVVQNARVRNSIVHGIEARANPMKLTYASSGVGGSQHLLTALFLAQARAEVLHVPFQGSGPL